MTGHDKHLKVQHGGAFLQCGVRLGGYPNLQPKRRRGLFGVGNAFRLVTELDGNAGQGPFIIV